MLLIFWWFDLEIVFVVIDRIGIGGGNFLLILFNLLNIYEYYCVYSIVLVIVYDKEIE